MTDTESTISQIIEDLKFYGKMGLIVRTIELGYSAWADVQMRNDRMYLRYGMSSGDYPTLFGIRIKVVNSSNPWARGYKFADTNLSICPPSGSDGT